MRGEEDLEEFGQQILPQHRDRRVDLNRYSIIFLANFYLFFGRVLIFFAFIPHAWDVFQTNLVSGSIGYIISLIQRWGAA